MIPKFERSESPFHTRFSVVESVSDHRARIAREQEEIEQSRLAALAGQVAITNNPSERIHIWEQLHGLSMPLSSTHRLLDVIATATDLQLDQVQEVQRLRRLAASNIAAATTAVSPKA